MRNLRIVIVDDHHGKLTDTCAVVLRVFADPVMVSVPEPWAAPLAAAAFPHVCILVHAARTDTQTDDEWAEHLLQLKPDLIILDNNLATADSSVSGMMIAFKIRRLPGGDAPTIFANTYGGQGWSADNIRRAFKRAANVIHGAGSLEELESALVALKAEKFPEE